MKNLSKEIINSELKEYFNNNKDNIYDEFNIQSFCNLYINGNFINGIQFIDIKNEKYLYIKTFKDIDEGIKVYDANFFNGHKIYGIKYKKFEKFCCIYEK